MEFLVVGAGGHQSRRKRSVWPTGFCWRNLGYANGITCSYHKPCTDGIPPLTGTILGGVLLHKRYLRILRHSAQSIESESNTEKLVREPKIEIHDQREQAPQDIDLSTSTCLSNPAVAARLQKLRAAFPLNATLVSIAGLFLCLLPLATLWGR